MTKDRERQIKRNAKGLCCRCNEKIYKSGFCEKHYNIVKEYQRDRYRRRRAEKLCSRCSNAEYKSGLCREHYEERKEYNRNRYRRKHNINIDKPVRH